LTHPAGAPIKVDDPQENCAATCAGAITRLDLPCSFAGSLLRISLASLHAARQSLFMASTLIFRKARPSDAETIARIYVDAWRDTYPLMLPTRVLSGMTVEGQAARWRNAISLAAREVVYVVETDAGKILGMTSMGRARDSGLGYDAEIYTLYVDPMMTGLGVGRKLLAGGFAALSNRGHARCVIWAHAKNPARFFYEAMGGKLIAERTTSMVGIGVPEVAFGWPKLALAESRAR
jgi:GNAT superfamily N-acetyltransferase